MKEIKLNVSGMHCAGCEARIKNALLEIDGVEDVEAHHETGEVKVVAKENVDVDTLKVAISNLEFIVED